MKSSWISIAITAAITVAFGLVPISGFAQDYPSGESGDQPSYPGIPPTQGKLEGTLGSYNLRAYGTVLLNISALRTRQATADHSIGSKVK